MRTPSAHELEARIEPVRPRDLSRERLVRVRERSKRMFGNQDRLEVAVAIARSELEKVNATDLHADLDVAVNRIRAQLLALESLGLLTKVGDEHGKRMFQRVDREHAFWTFALREYKDQLDLR